MGKMILCSGIRTTRPYVFVSTGIRIYSIEELCYYINHNICFISEEVFSYSLINWIDTELKLSGCANKLKVLKSDNADLKAMLTVVLCSCDFYSEYEVKSILKLVDKIALMTPVMRNFVKANTFLKKGRYAEAIGEYERILISEDAVGLTPEEYGDILHNFAVAKIHVKGLKEASETFREAFERNQRKESLLAYMYTLNMYNDKDEFGEKLTEYNLDDNMADEINSHMDRMYDEARDSKMMDKIHKLKRLRTEGRVNEYQNYVDKVINNWIESVRQI